MPPADEATVRGPAPTGAGAVDVAPSTAGRASAWRGAGAGFVAAGLALATTEFVGTVLNRTKPSIISAVADRLIVMWAGSLKNFAVDVFGTHDKAALLTGIAVVSLAVGTVVGAIGRRWLWVMPIVLVGFGVLGIVAADADPLASTGDAVASALIGAAAGSIAYVYLIRLRSERADTWEGRRAFLIRSASFAVIAVVGASVSRSLRTVGRVVTNLAGLPAAKRTTPLPTAQPFAVPGLTTYLTPANRFYRIDTATFVPVIDAKTWQLKITGLVDKPKTFTYADLLSMDLIEEPVTIACVSNDVGGHLIGNGVWRGVPLQSLLNQVGVHPDASQIVGRAVDDFTVGFPTAAALDGRVAMVALGLNGDPITGPHGYPARLIVAGLYGYVSATKWLSEINLTRWDDFNAFWVDQGWAKEGPIKTETRIDVPGSGLTVPAGTVTIAGIAWAPNIGISKVEVQIDRGPWLTARLGAVASRNTWVQWMYVWEGARPGDHVVGARATDARGLVQTDYPAPPDPSGASGYPYRGFRVS